MRSIIISIVVAGALIGGAILFVGRGDNKPTEEKNIQNVSVVDGKQVIEISAKGGYSPQLTVASSSIPTVLKVNTQGTFDCSASLTIPQIGYREFLPPNGETLIDIPAQKPGTILQGICSMGMYNFQIRFE